MRGEVGSSLRNDIMATIRKRLTKDGKVRWVMRVYVGRDDNGKRQFVIRTFPSERAAKVEARRLEGQKDTGRHIVRPTKQRLGSYLQEWLVSIEDDVSARTLHDYRGIVGRYIQTPPADAPELARIPLQALRRADFDRLYSFLRKDRGLSKRTVAYLHAVLHTALEDAVGEQLEANPLKRQRRKRKRRQATQTGSKVVRAMSEEQAGRFLEAARADRYTALWFLLLDGGLRPSEALGLAWEHVDFDAGRVRVVQALTRRGVKGFKLEATKTPDSARSVPLTKATIAALQTWQAKQDHERETIGDEWEDTHGLVFTTPFGKPLRSENLQKRAFARILEAAGLGEWTGEGKARKFRPAFVMYDLRHSCATLLLGRGVPMKVVSERLGHSTIRLTADTYSHVAPTMQRAAVDHLETMFGGLSVVA